MSSVNTLAARYTPTIILANDTITACSSTRDDLIVMSDNVASDEGAFAKIVSRTLLSVPVPTLYELLYTCRAWVTSLDAICRNLGNDEIMSPAAFGVL